MAHLSRQYSGCVWALAAVLLSSFMVLHPKDIFMASLAGLEMWWHVVFPALLPFFVVSELFIGLGVVQFLGVLLEPVMRPVFNVPGSGSFVLAVGYTSGFPIGSVVTARMRQNRLCTKIEAERLFSFTNNASPLFMFGAVAVGMYNQPELGIIIAGSHYLANLLMGLALRFYGRRDPEILEPAPSHGNILVRAAAAMLQAQRSDSRPLGKLLGDSIRSSISNLLNICGFIILFSVIIKILSITGVHGAMSDIIHAFLQPAGFSYHASQALSTGFFEMTLGTKIASEGVDPLWQKVVISSAILGWSGLAIHAQVASMVAESHLKMSVFVLTRIGHSILAAVLAFFFIGPWRSAAGILVKPVFLFQDQLPSSLGAYYSFSLVQLSTFLLAAAVLALIFHLARSLQPLFRRRWFH